MGKTAEDAGKALAAWGWHHPLWAVIIIVVAVVAVKLILPAPAQGAAVVNDWAMVPVGIAIVGIVWYAIRHQKPAPRAAPAHVTHTTVVQHVTEHVTRLPAGNGGWVVAGIGVVMAAGVVIFLNRTRAE